MSTKNKQVEKATHTVPYMASPLYPGQRLLLLIVGATLILQYDSATQVAGAGNRSLAKYGCQEKCGSVSIPYPFGVGHGCFLQEDFEVTCEKGQAYINMATASLFHGAADNVSKSKVQEINLLHGEARIQNSMGLGWTCSYINNTTDIKLGQLALKDSFKFSTKNKFTAIGCATLATIDGPLGDLDIYASACASFCDSEASMSKNVECDGMGCCQTDIPGNLMAIEIGFINNILNNTAAREFSPCSYAFVAEHSFKFHHFYALSSNFKKQDGPPLLLDWNVGNETCVDAKRNLTSYACKATNSLCINSTNGSGYRCNCSPGYEGNPYLAEDGCQDIIECNYPQNYCINGTCTNSIGSYECSCPKGTQSKDPKRTPCVPEKALFSSSLQVKVVEGTSISFLVLIVCIFALLIKCQERKLAKEKERFFKQNGGHILYQQILSKQIDTVMMFTMEDLKKATNSFDRSRELGTGGHGTVYKGILEDNKVVAVKRSKIMNVVKAEEFVQEIIVLSQINHRNVVRLLGCCLEVEVPILVYEFIPNGTLFQLIHDNHGRPPVSLENRLRIAQESAEALAYLHLLINRPIIHGDVKSLNILLDENYMTKVTDFGASRILPKDAIQLMTMVQGTLGYLDPEYLQERKITEKSDVYSFGVVLLELITRKTAIYFEGPEEGKNLATSFLQSMKENRVESMLDSSIVGVGLEGLFQEVVVLASLCLSLKGEERPSMIQVADKLKAIRSTWREILLLKHEETQRLVERLAMDSVGDLSPSMYWMARMVGMDIETPPVNHDGTTSMP